MNTKKLLSFFILLAFSISMASPQDVASLISKYTGKNGEGYLQPLATSSGAVFNSGFYHGAVLKKNGFQAYLGIVTAAAFIPEKHKTFMATTEAPFTPQQTADAPTLFGSVETVEVEGDGGTVYVFPGGLNVSMVPFAIPQLSVGSLYGTDLTFRFFAYSIDEEIGKVSLFSWGIRHSVSQYLSSLPLDLAVTFNNSYFKLGDYSNSGSWILSAWASKRISIFTFYGALGFEQTRLDIDYHDEDEEVDIVFKDLKGKNSVRLTAGLTFNLGPVKLNVDYSLASQSTLSAGLGFAIGEN